MKLYVVYDANDTFTPKGAAINTELFPSLEAALKYINTTTENNKFTVQIYINNVGFDIYGVTVETDNGTRRFDIVETSIDLKNIRQMVADEAE